MIRYAASFDQSGYGTAARDTCVALIKAGFNIQTAQCLLPMSRIDVINSPAQDIINERQKIKGKIKINLAELIPPHWQYIFQKDTYNIGRFYWETDKLPDEWVAIINNGLCNEVWVACESNKVACLKSGVTKPIYIIPPYIDVDDTQATDSIIGGEPHAFRFYSIFQWTKRKNPEALIESYLKEFSVKDNVMLVLKTYGPNATFAERPILKEAVINLKRKLGKPDAPPIFLITEMLNPILMKQLHAQCHCYISAHRGEGWGIPIQEAMVSKNQIICTRLGGISEMLTDDSAYIIPHSLESVNGMPWARFYDESQQWGSIKNEDIQVQLRRAYNEKYDCSQRVKSYSDILNSISAEKIVELIKSRLNNVK